jgi:hypothetical protein
VKRRKFLKNTLLTAVGTAIPAGIVGMIVAKKPEVVSGFDLATGDDWTSLYWQEPIAPLNSNTIFMKTRYHRDDLFAEFLDETP